MKWDEIQRAVMEFERKGPVAQEEIDDLSNNERHKNISVPSCPSLSQQSDYHIKLSED